MMAMMIKMNKSNEGYDNFGWHEKGVNLLISQAITHHVHKYKQMCKYKHKKSPGECSSLYPLLPCTPPAPLSSEPDKIVTLLSHYFVLLSF